MCSSAPAAPAAPDYSGIAAANAASAQYAKEAADNDLAFRKQVYNDSKPQQDQLYGLATDIAAQQKSAGEFQDAQARSQWGDYQNRYRPIEMQTIMDSLGTQYLSDADRSEAANYLGGGYAGTENDRTLGIDRLARTASEGAALQAMQQTQAMANSAYSQQARALARMGGDPNKMAYAAAQLANNQTLNNVGAANQARTSTYDRGVGLRTGVANFGRNMPNTAGQAFGLASQAGNSAVGNQNTGFQSGLPYAQFQAGGYGSQMGAGQIGSQAALGMGNIYNQGYSTQMGGYNAAQNQPSGFGAALGLAGSLLSSPKTSIFGSMMGVSDRRLKENIVRVGLVPAHGIGLYEFNYKDVPGHRYRGVMADEVESVMPDAVVYDDFGFASVDYGKLGIQMVEV